MAIDTDKTATKPTVAAPPAAKAAPRRRRRSGHFVAYQIVAVGCLLLGVVMGRWTVHTPPPHRGPAPPAANTQLGRQVDPNTGIANPDVLVGKRVDYLYAGGTSYNPPYIPVYTFRKLGHWLTSGDAMPTLPAWAGSWIWNPDVRRFKDYYVMWFTAYTDSNELPVTGVHPRCLGWAVSKNPLGPFVPSATPSICQLNLYGAIDPRTFVAPNGQDWLYWKSDGNAVQSQALPTTIWAQRLGTDGTALLGPPIALMSNSQPWQGTVVESPQMVYARGHYYLFYSGNVSGSPDNGIGVATCQGPAGPCANTSSGPWLGASVASDSVGEESLFTQSGDTWILYSPSHAFDQTMSISRVVFGPNGPYIAAFKNLPSVPPAKRPKKAP